MTKPTEQLIDDECGYPIIAGGSYCAEKLPCKWNHPTKQELIEMMKYAQTTSSPSSSEQLIDEMVRDFTSVDYIVRPKSEVRRRINELVAAAKKEKGEPQQLIDEGGEKEFDGVLESIGWDYDNGGRKDAKKLKDFIRKEIAEVNHYWLVTMNEAINKDVAEAIERTREEDALCAEETIRRLMNDFANAPLDDRGGWNWLKIAREKTKEAISLSVINT